MEDGNEIIHEIYNCENRIRPTKNINFFRRCFLENNKNNFSNNILKNSLEQDSNKLSINKSLINDEKNIDFKNLNKSLDKMRNKKSYPINFFTKISQKEIEINENNNNSISNEIFSKYHFLNNDSFIKQLRKSWEKNNENKFCLSQFVLNHLRRIINVKNQIFKKEIENNIDEREKKEKNENFHKYIKIFNKEQPKSSKNISKLKRETIINENNIINNKSIKLIRKNSIVQLDFSSFENKDKYYLFDKMKKRNSNNKNKYPNYKNNKMLSKLKKYATVNKENDFSRINNYDINESTDLPILSNRKNNSFYEESKYLYAGENQNSIKGIYPKSVSFMNKPINYNLNFRKPRFFKVNKFPKIKYVYQYSKKSNSFSIRYN